MAGKRYRAKDRKVAKMERTGLVEENVRTGEKTRTSEGSVREITFDGRLSSGRIPGAQEHAHLEPETSGSNVHSSGRQYRSHSADRGSRGREKEAGYSSMDYNRQEAQELQDAFASSSQSSSRDIGSGRSHQSRNPRERETDGSGSQEPFNPYRSDPYSEKSDVRESAHFDDQDANGRRREDYTSIRDNHAENAVSSEISNDRDHAENSNSKKQIRNQRKAAEKYREQVSNTGEGSGRFGTSMENAGYPANYIGLSTTSSLSAQSENIQYGHSTRSDSRGNLHNGDLAYAGTNSTPPDSRLSGISSEDLHRKIRKDQVWQGFQQAQAAQGQGFSSSGEAVRQGTGGHSTGNPVPGTGNETDALSSTLQKSKLMFGDESSRMVRGAGMAMAGRAAGRLAYGAGRFAYRRLREDTGQEAEEIDDSVANDAIHQAEKAGTGAVRMASARSPNGRKSVRKKMNEKQRLMTAASGKKDLVSDGPAGIDKGTAGKKKKSSKEINRFWQRKRYKDAYKKARRTGGVLTGAGEKAYGSGSIFSRTLQRIRRMI